MFVDHWDQSPGLDAAARELFLHSGSLNPAACIVPQAAAALWHGRCFQRVHARKLPSPSHTLLAVHAHGQSGTRYPFQ